MNPDAVEHGGPAHNRHPLVVLDDETTLERIRAAAAARVPFSLLRLGDGEAVVLSINESSWLHDLADLHRHWGAERITVRDVLRVRRDLETALAHADLIGVRRDMLGVTLPDDLLDRPLAEIGDFVRENFNLRDSERTVKDNVARRFAHAHRATVSAPPSSGQEICSSWIHWEMLARGVVDELLNQATEVVLVTCHPELGPVVSEKFSVRVHLVAVPGKFVDIGQAGVHVPDRYGEIRSELTGFEPGTLALVGAGIPGKAYCHWLKEAGCVALDVGSIFDAWIGKPSRRNVLRERFGVVDGRSVPANLRLAEGAPGHSDMASAPAVPRRQSRGARAGAEKADQGHHDAAQRRQSMEVRLKRANRRRMKAERERDAALRELAALRGRRSVRAVLAAASLLRGQRR